MIFIQTETPQVASVLHRLTLAGWIEGHHFVAAVGYKLRWTDLGASRALLLKQVIQDHGLSMNENTVLRFNRLCLEKYSDISSEELPPVDVDFWLTCVKELGLENEIDCLWPLVEVLNVWKPQAMLNRA